MSLALLDLNDSNLQLWHDDHRLQSPGYALWEREQYAFGSAARAAARLRPRDINTRYWWQLNTQPLQPALGSARHHADLVHAHLQTLYRDAAAPAEMVLAVSGSASREQLALLLGIVQTCPFDAVGLVNRSVALASLYPGPKRVFHLELQLHQAVISELECRDERIELTRAVPLPGCGVLQLQERLVEIISGAFIRQTRFDPRRKAATEQQLYDALPDALQSLQADAETSMDLNGYHARIQQRELVDAGSRLFASVTEMMGATQAGDQLLADPLAALVPGWRGQLPNVVVLDANDLQRALHHHQQRLVQRDQALTLVTSLPLLEQHRPPARTTAATAPAAAEPPMPSHLLTGFSARPLDANGTALGAGWVLFRDAAGWRLRAGGEASLTVNALVGVEGQIVHCGDQIVQGDRPGMLVIAVEDREP